MEKLVENIWKFSDYFRGQLNVEESQKLMYVCFYLFQNEKGFLKQVEDLFVIHINDDNDPGDNWEDWDNFEQFDEYYKLDDFKRLLIETIVKLNNKKGTKGLFTYLDTIELIKKEPKTWFLIFKCFLPLSISGVSLKNLSQDQYSQLFEFFIEKFSNSSGKLFLGSSNRSIRDLMSILSGEEKTIFDPACGLGGFFNTSSKNSEVSYLGNEVDALTFAIAKLRFANCKNVKIVKANSLYNEGNTAQKVDRLVSSPPINQKSTIDFIIDQNYLKYGVPPNGNINFAWIQLALHHLSQKGFGFVIMSNSTLYSSNKKEEKIRKNLIDNNMVHGIISLPSKMLSGTSIPVSIWVLSKTKSPSKEVFLMDASSFGKKGRNQTSLSYEEINLIAESFNSWRLDGLIQLPKDIAKSISIEELRQNQYSLLPGRYLDNPLLNEINLNEAVELSALIKKATPLKNKPSEGIVKKISAKDLAGPGDICFLSAEKLANEDLSRGPIYLGNFLLLSRIGTNLKPSFVDEKFGYIQLMNVNAFNVDTSKIHVEFLINELNREYVGAQIKKFVVGTIMPSIKVDDILKIKINVPSLKDQENFIKVEKEIKNVSRSKKQEIEDLFLERKNQWIQNLGSKKHNILQPLNNAALQLEVILEWIDMNDGKIDLREDFPFKQGESALSNLQSIKYSLNKSIEYATNITQDVDFGIAKKINIFKKIREHLANKNCQNNITISSRFIQDKIEFEKPDGDIIEIEPIVEISELGVEQIINNIWENANKHGFINPKRSYQFIYHFTQQTFEDKEGLYLEISFKNNGKPFPKGMGTLKRFITQGEKAGETGNTGEGGARIYEIIKHFKGELEVYDEPSNNFPVELKIFFPLIYENEEV